jgi:hypothetical protein
MTDASCVDATFSAVCFTSTGELHERLYAPHRWDQDSERWFGFVLVARAVVCFNHLYRNDIVAAQTRR